MNINFFTLNGIRDFSRKLYRNFEYTIISIIEKLPDKCLPPFLLNCLDQYLDRRITDMEFHAVKKNWRNTDLQNTLDSLRR